MTVKEFNRKFDGPKKYYDINGVDISRKPEIILNLLQVIGSEHRPDGTINADVAYEE